MSRMSSSVYAVALALALVPSSGMRDRSLQESSLLEAAATEEAGWWSWTMRCSSAEVCYHQSGMLHSRLDTKCKDPAFGLSALEEGTCEALGYSCPIKNDDDFASAFKKGTPPACGSESAAEPAAVPVATEPAAETVVPAPAALPAEAEQPAEPVVPEPTAETTTLKPSAETVVPEPAAAAAQTAVPEPATPPAAAEPADAEKPVKEAVSEPASPEADETVDPTTRRNKRRHGGRRHRKEPAPVAAPVEMPTAQAAVLPSDVNNQPEPLYEVQQGEPLDKVTMGRRL